VAAKEMSSPSIARFHFADGTTKECFVNIGWFYDPLFLPGLIKETELGYPSIRGWVKVDMYGKSFTPNDIKELGEEFNFERVIFEYDDKLSVKIYVPWRKCGPMSTLEMCLTIARTEKDHRIDTSWKKVSYRHFSGTADELTELFTKEVSG
jgi:hypothetical protein